MEYRVHSLNRHSVFEELNFRCGNQVKGLEVTENAVFLLIPFLVSNMLIVMHMIFMRAIVTQCAGVIVFSLFTGCSLVGMEDSVQVSAASSRKSDDEGEKNLAAIKAIVAAEQKRGVDSSGPEYVNSHFTRPNAWPPDWTKPYSAPTRLSDDELERSTNSRTKRKTSGTP
ncbi:hypothetical protein W02_01110 [Nitrospira sp. KM1]|uniref:hypothetical protein n=1 Tax=Nitrospira sp. KM1 TaxID=1936990 RepID=UPI0013A76A5E|nr:hypothetical protein [Nitrospira sp. KM1]BCA52971.1 hypothetical protein W02_01110 [Nitrospira sp. KM1]